MNFGFLNDLEDMLQSGNIGKALSLVKYWLINAEPGDPQHLLEACNPNVTPKVALLLRDLIARYPHTIVGSPVLIYAEQAEELGSDGSSPQDPLPFKPSSFMLPGVREDLKEPCTDLTFLGWIGKSELDPNPNPNPNPSKDLEAQAPLERMFSAIALFKSTPEFFDQEEVSIPAMWWGELLAEDNTHMRIAARLILSYPEAREAALVLEAAANNKPIPKPLYFLSDLGLNWAMQEGLLFKDSCFKQFPSLRAV